MIAALLARLLRRPEPDRIATIANSVVITDEMLTGRPRRHDAGPTRGGVRFALDSYRRRP